MLIAARGIANRLCFYVCMMFDVCVGRVLFNVLLLAVGSASLGGCWPKYSQFIVPNLLDVLFEFIGAGVPDSGIY